MYCNWQCNYLPLVYHLPIAMNVQIVDLNVYLIMYIRANASAGEYKDRQQL